MRDYGSRRDYMLDYQKRWLAGRRLKGISLLGGKCAWCGCTEDLEFDHVDPATRDAKLVNKQGFPWNWAWERILVELAKCQLLCNGCHKAKTGDEKRAKAPHGTNSRYTSKRWPCRCPACRKAHADTNAKYR